MNGFTKPLKSTLKILGENFFIPGCWGGRILSTRIVWMRRGDVKDVGSIGRRAARAVLCGLSGAQGARRQGAGRGLAGGERKQRDVGARFSGS